MSPWCFLHTDYNGSRGTAFTMLLCRLRMKWKNHPKALAYGFPTWHMVREWEEALD